MLLLFSLGATAPTALAAPLAPRSDDERAAARSAQDQAPADEGTVIYELAFYDRYNPVTALDVVTRTPGFEIDRGGNRRGFSAGGNVLINGQRPSSKSDSVADILSRIAAGEIVRVELVRGATGGLDVSGQSVVANVVLRPATRGSGFAALETSLEADRVNFQAEASYDGQVGATDYLVGVERRGFDGESIGIERLTEAGGADQRRDEVEVSSGERWSANARTETRLGPQDLLRFSVQLNHEPDSSREVSNRFPAGGGPPDLVVETSAGTENSFEAGVDYQRRLTPALNLQLIALARRNFEDSDERLDRDPAAGEGERELSISSSTDGETIGRVEIDWSTGRHVFQASADVAQNFVDSDFALFEDLGGGLIPVDVEGANTRVSEMREEWLVTDSWRAAPYWTIDLGLGFEISTIRQSGDIDNRRTFRFAKPSLAVTYATSESQQWRFRFAREVAQLNFFDFVSSVDFGDRELEFGNPDLEPDRTWALEATFERRFGEIGVVEVRAFYDAIQEVQDLLPLGGIFEIPGNIGDGSRLGVDVSATVALDSLGLRESRLELGLFAQDTSVTDPVTGQERRLSGERSLRGSVSYRQEFPGVRLSWGASYDDDGPRRFFGLDELVIVDGGPSLEVFLEKVVLGGLKARFEAENLLDSVESRDRRVFAGARGLSLVRFREGRDRTEGREFSLSFSRTF